MFASLSPSRRRLVWAVIALLTAVVAAVVVSVVVRASGTSRGAPVAQDDPGPVVLVPGYGGGTGGLQQLARVLRTHGHDDVTVMTLPGDGTGDLAAQAAVLKSTVDAALARTHAASVDVVGYSAGGVVARLWARQDGGASQARRIVTLGSPQHGTDLAATAGSLLPGACPTACRQLEPDSSLLRDLNRGDETPAGPVWVSLWTTVDQVVDPPDSARLTGATDVALQSVCADSRVAHGDLPTDALVTGIVLDALGAKTPGPYAAADCTALRAAA